MDDFTGISKIHRELLEKWLWFYDELASGERAPMTEAQRRFVQVNKGQAEPKSEHEIAYFLYCKSVRESAEKRRILKRKRAREKEAHAKKSPGDRIPEFPEGVPRPDWFTREDYYRLHPNRRR